MKWIFRLVILVALFVINHLLCWKVVKKHQNFSQRNDSVLIPASLKYNKLNPLKWAFLGENYRREWGTPVSMPVFHINNSHGGFKIERLGGGEQTRSLHLINNDGTRWVLRSVDKDVTGAMPAKLKGSFAQRLVQDQISAAYPYALLTIQPLSDALGIPCPPAELVFVPDDPALGTNRALFANTVCFLIPKIIATRRIATYRTDTVMRLLQTSNHFRAQQQKILTVRLMDMLIADWDRHKAQWGWGSLDSENIVYIYPVPEDRDQAYFLSDGWLAKVFQCTRMPHLVGFTKEPSNLTKLSYKVHSFDRFFLNELNRSQWEAGVADFKRQLTDDVIEMAVKKLPPEIFKISGAEIISKLKSRRDKLSEEVIAYYAFLAKEVSISSTLDAELINVLHTSDSTVVDIIRTQDRQPIYHRAFYPRETAKITIDRIYSNDKVYQTGVGGIETGIIRIK